MTSSNNDSPVYLVFGGKTGWLGQQIVELLKNHGSTVVAATSRLENKESIERELDTVKPKYIINCAGLTGRPNVDWCEDNKEETIRVNVIGTLSLCDAAFLRNIHVTNFATGCIYQYDGAHPIGSNKGFTEDDTPNFDGSFYSLTKGMVEKLLRNYSNVLTLRVRMPLSDELNPRNFIAKIIKYEKVVNIPNSMTILYEMLPIAVDMTRRDITGVYNFTNPGVISHNEVLQLYKQYVDPKFVWKNFTVEEQAQILKAARSNNMLDTTKLQKLYPQLTPIQEAMPLLMQRMGKKLKTTTA